MLIRKKIISLTAFTYTFYISYTYAFWKAVKCNDSCSLKYRRLKFLTTLFDVNLNDRSRNVFKMSSDLYLKLHIKVLRFKEKAQETEI